MSVLYNGLGGVYGYAQQIYEVPEPGSASLLVMGAAVLLARRKK